MSTVSSPLAQRGEKLGLLLVGHGSPAKTWNERFLQFCHQVTEAPEVRAVFDGSGIGFLEFAQPDVAAAVKELEEAGCQRIIAVPIFVSVGRHTLFDVPAALGIFYSAGCLKELERQGFSPARPRVPVIYTTTPDEGSVLADFVVDEIESLSRRPHEEAVVLLIHGEADLRPMLEKLLRRIATFAAAKTGIEVFSWAFVGVGQGFHHHGLQAIEEAACRKKRILVVALYVALSAHAIFERSLREHPELAGAFEGKDVVLSQRALLDSPRLARWVVETSTQAARTTRPTCEGQ